MAFATGYLSDPQKVHAGETVSGAASVIFSTPSFENGLVVGRFAKLDTGRIDNIDGSATPVIAGVVLRNVANPVEDGGTYDTTITVSIDYQRAGLCTVEVVAADTPTMYGPVFVKNAAGADAGKATTVDDATTEPSNFEFIQQVQAGVWLVRGK